MSEMQPGSAPHGAAEPHGAHEPSDAEIGPVLRFALGLAVVIAVTMAFMAWLFDSFSAQAARSDAPPSPLESLRKPPPEPLLEISPPANLKAIRAEEEARLGSYGWIAREAGLVHIPIEQAMDRIVEKGLPVRGTAAVPERPGP
jgi:hypothetical protein